MPPPWLADLRMIVRARRDGGEVPADVVGSMLRKLVDAFAEPTDDHGVWWSAENWIQGFRLAGSAEIRSVADQIEHLADSLPAGHDQRPGWRWITRSDVFARKGDPLGLFLAAMAWGYGTRGLGWWRTRDIATAAGGKRITDAVGELAAAYTSGGPAATWAAISRSGDAKLPGVDTAFGSKIAYFGCYDRVAGHGPLIADNRTAWAFWAVDGSWDVRADPDLYARYMATAEMWAAEHGWRSDDIERALFNAGPHVMMTYRADR